MGLLNGPAYIINLVLAWYPFANAISSSSKKENIFATGGNRTRVLSTHQTDWPVPSVTIFGEISPLWKFLAIFSGLFHIWKVLKSLWHDFDVFGQFFSVVKGQILKKNLAIWSHCVCPSPLPGPHYISCDHRYILSRSWNLLNRSQLEISKLRSSSVANLINVLRS